MFVHLFAHNKHSFVTLFFFLFAVYLNPPRNVCMRVKNKYTELVKLVFLQQKGINFYVVRLVGVEVIHCCRYETQNVMIQMKQRLIKM